MTAHSLARGTVVFVNLEPVLGHEQGRVRPCVVVQQPVSQRYSTMIVVLPITSKNPGTSPIYIQIARGDGGLTQDSFALCDQIRAIDIRRIRRVLGVLSDEALADVEVGLLLLLGLKT